MADGLEMCCERCVFDRGKHAPWCWLCVDCGNRVHILDAETHGCAPIHFLGVSQVMGNLSAKPTPGDTSQ